LRPALRLGGALLLARGTAVTTAAKLRTGAVADLRLALALLRLALAAPATGPVGGVTTPLALALISIRAVALLQTGAAAIPLPAVVLAIAVAPTGPIDATIALTVSVSPRRPVRRVAISPVRSHATTGAMTRISLIAISVPVDPAAIIAAAVIGAAVIGAAV
jgi:hypothetical protein